MIDPVAMINDPDAAVSHKCLVRIIAVHKSLKSAEKKAADYLLSHPAQFAEETVAEAAAHAGCSEATLVRLARKLGYAGYTELKGAVLRTEGENNLPYPEISGDDGEAAVLRKVFQASIQAMSDSLGMIDRTAYEKAAQAVRQAGRLLFLGAGDAAAVAMAGYHKFARLGVPVEFPQDFDAQLLCAAHLGPEGVLLVVSHSGRTKTVLDAARCAKNGGACVIAITNNPLSTLAKLASVSLTTAAFMPSTAGEIVSKRLPALCLIESLYVSRLRALGEAGPAALQQSGDALAANKL